MRKIYKLFLVFSFFTHKTSSFQVFFFVPQEKYFFHNVGETINNCYSIYSIVHIYIYIYSFFKKNKPHR